LSEKQIVSGTFVREGVCVRAKTIRS
jgi:hypothetical protein